MTLTPEQKANQLVEEFLNAEHCHKKHIPNNRYCDCTYMGRFQAKQCALICVEFAQSNPLNTDGYNKYLIELKQEIVNL